MTADEVAGVGLRFGFHAPMKPLNSNLRLPWPERFRRTQAWRNAGHMHARSASGRHVRRLDRARIDVWIAFPDRRRRDVGNWYPTAKAIVDGIVDGGILDDDNDDHVEGPFLHPGDLSPRPVPHVTVTLTPIPPKETA